MPWTIIIWMGCAGTAPVSFPPGLAPLDQENEARWPADAAQAIDTEAGEADDFTWAHARGYVHAPIADVYTCLQDDRINVDRREVARWSRVDDVEDGYEHSYRLDIEVENIINLSFSDTWRHGSTRDEETDEILLTISASQLTEGNPYMRAIRGSIVAEVHAPGVTSLDIVQQQDVTLPDLERMQRALTDMHAEVVACVNGQPLPSYD
ncbi:MAG: hypothetical protein AAFV53_41570 [Myxococcota bacterium]